MKLLSSLVAAALALSAVQAMPATESIVPSKSAQTIPTDPTDRVTFYRAQVQRYENPIIQTYLARAALNGSTPLEIHNTASLFAVASKSKDDFFWQHDEMVRFNLKNKPGKPFASVDNFPPADNYATPVVLPRDAVLDKPVVGKGIFPLGRRPQDELNIVEFVKNKLQRLPEDDLIDFGSTVLLDATLLQLISARILLGFEIGQAKFDRQKDTFCRYMNGDKIQRDEIMQILTDTKQYVNVLGRVQDKAEAFTQTFRGEKEVYPEHTAENVLRLFQAYIIPITTEVEYAIITSQAGACKK